MLPWLCSTSQKEDRRAVAVGLCRVFNIVLWENAFLAIVVEDIAHLNTNTHQLLATVSPQIEPGAYTFPDRTLYQGYFHDPVGLLMYAVGLTTIRGNKEQHFLSHYMKLQYSTSFP